MRPCCALLCCAAACCVDDGKQQQCCVIALCCLLRLPVCCCSNSLVAHSTGTAAAGAARLLCSYRLLLLRCCVPSWNLLQMSIDFENNYHFNHSLFSHVATYFYVTKLSLYRKPISVFVLSQSIDQIHFIHLTPSFPSDHRD